MAISINGTTGISGVDGSAGTPALQGSDTNTGIAFGSDVILGSTGGTERFRCDSSGRLLVGTSTSTGTLAGVTPQLQIEGTSYDTSAASLFVNANSASTAPVLFLGKSRGTANGSSTVVQSGDRLGAIFFQGADGVNRNNAAAFIEAYIDGTPGANDMPGRLVFSTTADGASSPTEQMRITNGGLVLIGATSFPGVGTSTTGVGLGTSGSLSVHRSAATSCYFGRTNDGEVVALYSGTSQRGYISISGATTTFGSVSDYRLKENIASLSNGLDKVMALKPKTFNFIEFPDQQINGFIAHEVQEVIPEAVTGTKDAVDDDGNPVYQGIDQSKLVPLLTAALQEAIAKIESLETRLAVLEVTP